MTRSGPFPEPPARSPSTKDRQMIDRDQKGAAQHGLKPYPWGPPAPKPEGPKELDEVAGRNVKRGFEG